MTLSTPVAITAFRFNRKFEAIPRRIEFDGVSYELNDTYKRIYLVSDDGAETIFDLSDDAHTFRLREQLFGWRLVAMSSKNA